MKALFFIVIVPFSIHGCDLGAALATLHYAFQQRQAKEQETGNQIDDLKAPFAKTIDFPLASYGRDASDQDLKEDE